MLRKVVLVPLILVGLLGIGCNTPVTEPGNTTSAELSQAKPYIVLGEGNIANEAKDRTVGLWFIVSQDADSFEEYAETAIQAVCDLYRLHGRVYTSVILIPNPELEYALSYAHASYAADGKGALGMTGSAPANPMYWRVYATDHPCTEQELSIAELWWKKIPDFPSKDPFSSLSYDMEALRQYVSDTLDIPIEEVVFPEVSYRDYEYDDRL